MDRLEIDRGKFCVALRRLRSEDILCVLDKAIRLLPETELPNLAKHYFDLSTLQLHDTGKGSLLAEVKAFEKASLAGEYYEDFSVNSKNFMEISKGTAVWIAEFHRLLNCCVAQEKTGDPVEVGQAFDVIFGLLDFIDGGDEIIFFADEGGSWQVGVDWEKVLPSWFNVLSIMAEPKVYARQIWALLKCHYNFGREKMLVIAQEIATPDQRKALDEVMG